MDLGSGSTYSENMSAASGGPGGSQNQGPSGFGGGDSGGGNDVYSGYVAASQPRGGLQGIKDYFTGGGYDYGYQPTFAKTLGGIGNLLLGSINPVLGGLNFLRQNIGPEFDRFRQAPTLDRYLNPEKYVNQPYVIGSNPMDTQRFNKSQFGQTYDYPEYNKLQKEYEEKINRDLLTNPETQIFDLTGGGINSLRSTLEVPNFDIENQFAEVTKQDLARYNKGKGRMAETIQKTNLQDLKDMGIINPTMTEYEFDQLKKGNITKPGTYVG
jgi:hypothetical protein